MFFWKRKKEEKERVKVLTPSVPRDYPLLLDHLYVGRGINLRQKERGEVHIYLKERNTHLLGLGRTRWGKTQFIRRCSGDDIEFGNSLVCIDPKGSYDWVETICYVAYKVGRLKEVMFFNLLYPEVSVRINPLYGLPPEKIGEFFYRSAPESDDAFFPQVSRDIGYTVALALKAMGKEEINIFDVYSNSGVKDFAKLEQKLLSYQPKTDRERALYRRYFHDALEKVRKIANKDPGYWSKVNTTFEVSVSQLATGRVGELMGKVYGNPLAEKLLKGEPVIFFAYLGVLEIGETTGQLVAKLLSSVTHHVYGVYYTENKKMLPPVAEYWDEASNVFYDGAQDKFNKAGGCNVYIHAFTQSLADPQKAIGKELTKILQDNANVLLFSVIDAETQAYFEKMFGYYEGYEIIWKKDDFDLVQEKKPLVPADAFARLWKGAFHACIEGRYYRGYSPLLKVPEVWLYPLPYPTDRIIAKKFGVDPKYATYDQKKYAEEISRDFDLFLRENEKHNFFSGIVINLQELEYYKEFVKKFLVQGVTLEEKTKEVKEVEENKEEKEQQEELPDLNELLAPSTPPATSPSSSAPSSAPTDTVAEELRKLAEKYGVNRIDKSTKNLLMVFKQGDHVYFREVEAKKVVETKNLEKVSVRYDRVVGKTKIPTTDFYVRYPAHLLGLSEEEDCTLIKKISLRK
jgi:hypothetical protein